MTAPRFEANPPGPGPRVQGFAGRSFLVDGAPYESVLLTPERAARWEAPALDRLEPAHVESLLALEPPPEFLILGTGAAQAFPPRGFVAALEAMDIGVEAMDSRAAARTWAMLRGEGRWIVAALMPL
ncbi:MAG TPA: MTH938/NDUFAF3 family protein [Allosphingosinicella sp.]|nr:MTH938/NDUFAF3 family protein [Allosphingosinicella sp.]